MKSIYPNHLPERAPKYIIAFRGTIPKPRSTVRQDLKLNIKVLTDELHMDKSRFKHVLEAVKKVVQEAGSANIWLAGHSLGSAIAMLVGKSMAQKEHVKAAQNLEKLKKRAFESGEKGLDEGLVAKGE
ncbi:hypothetical protein VitviT2T_025446 [Vitis vinifera]|uniref:Fungal lipase-type domain-containing protein n=1 Tax=Vitis vinifera TaxID=29760 RepID=A0ABY9DKV5_VITVI|nr:hypothetical protein VitviT2T_025446 [Vitis vinifera]